MSSTTPPKINERFGGAITVGVIIAFLLMLLLPISQMLSEGFRETDRRADVTVIEPPDLMEEPPPPEELEEQEEIEELEQEREPPTLEQLELAMNTDVSSFAGGDFSMPSYDISGDMQDLIYELSQLTVMPREISQPAPQYPPDLQRSGVAGRVQLVFVVRPDGSTDQIRVASSTNPAFEEPAIRAVRRWRFEPGEKDGKAVSTRVRITIPFNVN